MLNIKAFLASLSSHPGVYQMLDADGKILYIGKARNLKKRITSYFSKQTKDTKTIALIKHIHDIHVTITHSEIDALLLECNLIKKHQPHYNILFRDDKSYPYILITNEDPYPAIDFYRGSRKTKGHYFGPYPSASAVRETIHLLQKLFGLRLAKDRYYKNRTRPCLQYQIGLCSGACAGLISKEEYAEDIHRAILFLQGKNEEVSNDLNQKMELAATQLKYEKAAKLRDQIAKLRGIHANQHVSTHHGDADVVGFADICIQLLVIRGGRILGSRAYFPTIPAFSHEDEIISSFLIQHYLDPSKEKEIVPKEIILNHKLNDSIILEKTLRTITQRKINIIHNVRGERKKWLEIANKTAEQSKASFLLNKASMQDRFTALETELNLHKKINRIECFDVSHTRGEATSAACVVFNREGPLKSDYRRFNINDITPGDDIAAMRQALHRRYQRQKVEGKTLPDLLLIDGGKTQLGIAKEVLSELNLSSIKLLAVAKGPLRKPGFETLYFDSNFSINLSAESLALHLIQHIRDEAHRFAITGHRHKRAKVRKASTLESIPGIGAKRRRELLRYFGGIAAINRASLEEIAKVPGISQSLAKRIFAILHNETE